MAQAAPVVEEVPAAVLFGVSAVAFASWLSLFLMRLVVFILVSKIIYNLASFLPSWFGIRHDVQKGIDYVGNKIETYFGEAATAAQHLGSATFNDGWKITKWVGGQIEYLAVETAHGFRVLVESTIPTAITDIVHPLRAAVADATRVISHVERDALREVRKAISKAEAGLAAATGAGEAALLAVHHAIDVTLPNDISLGLGGIRRWIDKTLEKVEGRLTRLEKAIGVGALTGVIIAALAKELPWIRCKNVGSAGKALCGIPVKQLEGLLADFALGLTVILGTLSLQTLATDMQSIVGDLQGEIGHFWRTDVKHTGGDRQIGEPGS